MHADLSSKSLAKAQNVHGWTRQCILSNCIIIINVEGQMDFIYSLVRPSRVFNVRDWKLSAHVA